MAASAFAACLLASCSERAQEMEEKITQMQRELDEAHKQLAAANQALASRTPAETPRPAATPAASTSGGLPSREALEASYNASVAEFRKKLDANLGEFRVESCTVHSVQMPSELYPFTSQLSFAFASANGKTFTTDIPVKADVNGKWVFPSVDEVVQRVTSAERMASAGVPPISNAPSGSARSGKGDQPPAYMAVDGTVVVQWPDASPAAASRAPSAAAPAAATPRATIAAATPAATLPPPAPRPQASAAPSAAAVMPVDRDVHIQFPTPP
jgi:hypothetical protein